MPLIPLAASIVWQRDPFWLLEHWRWQEPICPALESVSGKARPLVRREVHGIEPGSNRLQRCGPALLGGVLLKPLIRATLAA